MVTTEQIKELRDRTGISITQCKEALEEAGGNMDGAVATLKTKGAEVASKKLGRNLGAGVVASYIHNAAKLGVLLELHVETDFVAKNDEFKKLADDIAMHIAASNPEDSKELMEQPYIKNPEMTISEVIEGAVQKFGERIEVGNFKRLEL